MNATVPLLAWALLGSAGLTADTADDRADDRADTILDRYESLRPSPEELAMYGLDWAVSLEQGLERARKEERPVLLVIIHARYGDITSGHC